MPLPGANTSVKELKITVRFQMSKNGSSEVSPWSAAAEQPIAIAALVALILLIFLPNFCAVLFPSGRKDKID